MNLTAVSPRSTRTDFVEDDLPQFTRRQIFGVWAAATIPMSVLGWIVAP